MAFDITPLGTILKDKFQIIQLVKRGGMGAVFKVRDIKNGNIYALKELLDPDPNPVERENNLKMFQEEARLLSNLSHPNIPSVIAYFNVTDRHYLVMDFIEGENLEEKLNKALQGGRNLSIKQVLQWACQVCKVFDYLHNNIHTPIIFRDLKPANIMITPDGKVKLIDFGIARTYKAGKRKDTFIFGTINYASPEHRGLSQTDYRSDIYTLGATLYHLLTGYPPVPFHTPQHGSLIKKNPELSGAIEGMVIKAMAQDKSDRYQSAKEMMGAIENILEGVPEKKIAPKSSPPVSIPQVTAPPVSAVKPRQSAVVQDGDVKHCARCGTPNRIKAKYCNNCRYILVSPPKKTEDKPYAVKEKIETKMPQSQLNSSNMFFDQGLKFFKEGAFTKAGQEFQKAIQFDLRNARASFMLGRVYCEIKDYRQGLNFFHRALEIDPDNQEIITYIGRTSLELKDYNGAERAFLHSLKFNPRADETLRWLGKTYLARKENQKALEYFEKALQINPHNLPAYLDLFYACRQMTYYHKGLEWCRKAMEIDRNNPEVYFCMGLSCTDTTDFKDAIKYFKKVLSIKPDYWQANYHAGIVYRYMGKDRDAITEFKKALTFSPANASLYRAIAISHRQLGSISKAKKALDEAIRLDPHNPENKELMDSLKNS